MAVVKQYKYQSSVGHNWDEHPQVEGEAIAKGDVVINKRKVRYVEVDTGDGVVRVLEFAALQKAFDVISIGDEVSFKYLGMTKSKSKRDVRRFDVTVAESGLGGARVTKTRKIHKPWTQTQKATSSARS